MGRTWQELDAKQSAALDKEWRCLSAHKAVDELMETRLVPDDILDVVRAAIKKAAKGE